MKVTSHLTKKIFSSSFLMSLSFWTDFCRRFWWRKACQKFPFHIPSHPVRFRNNCSTFLRWYWDPSLQKSWYFPTALPFFPSYRGVLDDTDWYRWLWFGYDFQPCATNTNYLNHKLHPNCHYPQSAFTVHWIPWWWERMKCRCLRNCLVRRFFKINFLEIMMIIFVFSRLVCLLSHIHNLLFDFQQVSDYQMNLYVQVRTCSKPVLIRYHSHRCKFNPDSYGCNCSIRVAFFSSIKYFTRQWECSTLRNLSFYKNLRIFWMMQRTFEFWGWKLRNHWEFESENPLESFCDWVKTWHNNWASKRRHVYREDFSFWEF